MHITHALAAVTIGVGLAVAGCGDDDDGGATDQPQFNTADVEFAQGMIPHHEQAIEMAQLAQDRATDPATRQLADEIEGAQGPEIETMRGWLEEWGEAEMDMDSGMDHDMSGMMSDQEMSMLESMSGREFERMFLQMMIEHHQGAIEMAQTEQADGENREAIEMAEEIEAAQSKEIARMKAMLAQ